MKFWTATYARNVDMWLTWSGDRDMENSNVQTPELSVSIYNPGERERELEREGLVC